MMKHDLTSADLKRIEASILGAEWREVRNILIVIMLSSFVIGYFS